MKGLIRKELYCNKQNFIWAGIFALLFFSLYAHTGSKNMFFVFYPALLTSTFFVSSISIEESDHWDVYATALPCSRAQLVSVKFLVILAIALILAFLTLVSTVVSGASQIFTVPCLTLTYLLVVVGINLFAAFKWGSRKSRLPSTILTLALFFLLSFGILGSSTHPNLLFLLLAVAVLLFCLLWLLSIRAYQKRDL